MKKTTRKKILLTVSVLLVTALLALSLTACLKIGMTKKNIVGKLTDVGATVSYERTSPMTVQGQSSHRIGDIVLAKLVIDGGEETDGSEESLYVFFAMDSDSAQWVEDKCREYIDANAEECGRWNVYRYEETVMCGHYKLLSIARGY